VVCKSATTGNGKHKKTVQKCTTKLTSSPVTVKTTGDVVAAVVSRGDVVYATGSAIRLGKRTKLSLTPLHRISTGRYLLTLTHGRKYQRETITIA
jgi:ribulose-5-phosphate 4-epimerase/fuculose-1-phosphate aldolase